MLTVFLFIAVAVVLAGAVVYGIVTYWDDDRGKYLPPPLPPPSLPPAPPPPASTAPHWTRRAPTRVPETKFRVREVRRLGADVKPTFGPQPTASNGFRKTRKLINLDATCNRTGRVVRECKCDDCRALRVQHGN